MKRPMFYEDYVGPRLAQLDVVRATGKLLRDGSFRFLGVNQGVINPNVRATYVFGVDRSGNLPTGPFPDRPNIRFDATVVIKIVPGQSPTVTVTDLANKTSTTVQNAALADHGHGRSGWSSRGACFPRRASPRRTTGITFGPRTGSRVRRTSPASHPRPMTSRSG